MSNHLLPLGFLKVGHDGHHLLPLRMGFKLAMMVTGDGI